MDSGRPAMTLAQVVDTMIARNAERAWALESYRGTRTYTVQYKGFFKAYRASLVVDMTYQAPGTKTFKVISQGGTGFLVNRVLKRLVRTEQGAQKDSKSVNLNRRNYNFTDLQWKPAADGCSYGVSVRPRHAGKLLYRGRIWINDQDFAVCRLEVEPARNPSFWIKGTQIFQTYHRVGRFWLPQKNTSISKIRLGGSATLTIDYSNQKILAARP